MSMAVRRAALHSDGDHTVPLGDSSPWFKTHGEEVPRSARGAHPDALRSDGLTVETAADGGRFTVRPACAADPAALGVQDVVVVAVKGPALASVASGIAPLLGPDTVVVTVTY